MAVRKAEVKVEQVPLASLKAYDGNAKKHDNRNVEAIAKSIEEFGFRNPIIAWHNEDGVPEIVAGHGRAAAAKRLRIETVPVVFVDDLSDAQRRMLTLADNQTTLMTGWDEEQLAEELDALSDAFNVDDFGFEPIGVEEPDPAELDECAPNDGAQDRVMEGELWRMGEHVLLCADSTNQVNVERLSDAIGTRFDLLLTDPPYNVTLGQYDSPSEAKQLHRRTDGLVIANDSWCSDEGFVEFLRASFSGAMSVMRPGAAFYVWYASTQSANFLEAAKRAGLEVRQILVWAKNTFTLGRQDYQWMHEPCLYGWKEGAAHYFTDSRRESTVIDDAMDTSMMSKAELKDALDAILESTATTVLRDKKPTRSVEHPTMKPVSLFAYQISNSSKPGDAVLDPFGGSGTSVIACEQLSRRCGTIELDPHYASVIVDRWERLTGMEAVRIE